MSCNNGESNEKIMEHEMDSGIGQSAGIRV